MNAQTKRAHAVHLERAVREIAMEHQRQADRAQEVRRRPETDERPAERHGERPAGPTPAPARRSTSGRCSVARLNLSQGAGDRNTGRANRREQAADCSHHRGKNQAVQQQPRRDPELERQLAEAGHVHRAGRQAVHRQRQQAADRRRRSPPAPSTRPGTRTRCATARSRARAACRSRACGRPPPRTSCSSRRTPRRSTGSR